MTVDSLNRPDMKKLMVENCTIQQEYSYIQNQTTLQTYPLVACLKTQVNDGGIQYLHHEYDSKGNLTHVYEDNADTIKEYHYDDTNQLIFERNETQSAAYTYDAGGNITSKTENDVTTEWLYEDEQWKDLLTSFDGQTITYDEIGNPLTYRDGMSFAWEKGRQLKQVTKADETVSYQYNSSGLRTQKISSQYGTTVFILEGDCILSSSNGAETIYFYYDENNRAIAMRVNDTMYAFEHNVHGDVVGIFDTEGNLVVKYSYNAWGVPIEIVDGNGTDVSRDRTHVANKNPYRYRGYYYDVETGLYYLKTRYYDPITCRFINQDNLLGANEDIYSYNLFAYCSNNPINLIDPNGTFAGAIFGLICAAVTAITAAVTSYAVGQSKPNTGITWEDVGNAVWNTITFIVDPVGSIVRAVNPPAVQSTQKEQVEDRANTTPIVHSVPIRTGWPKLDKPRFPADPALFHPKGLIITTDLMTPNGQILKWTYPSSKYAIFEWNEDYAKGEHYHCLTEAMRNSHSGDHWKAGDLIPEPWASIYF